MPVRNFVVASLLTLASSLPLMAAENPLTPGSDALMVIEPTERPLEQVLQWISRRSGVNIVCNEKEQPKITMRLVNVTWQEAVEQIARKYAFVIEKKSDRLWQLTNPPLVSMQLQDASLVKVMEAIARQAGVNIVISDDIDKSKTLTMVLNGVPWKEALDVVVKASGYAWIEQDYSIVRVVSKDKIKQDLSIRIFPLNYATATDIDAVISKQLAKDEGSTIVDPRSNKIIVTATAVALEKIAKTIAALDTRTRQVLIEMKFVEYSTTDAQRLGFDPLLLAMDVKDLGQVGFGTSPFGTLAPFGGFPFTGTNGSSTGLSRDGNAVPTSTGRLSVRALFEAIQTLKSTEVLQAPQLLTLDNKEASLEIGRELHFAEAKTSTDTNGVTTTSVQEATTSPVKDGVTILLKPTITGDGFVLLTLDAKNEEATLDPVKITLGKDTSEIILPNKDLTHIKTSIMIGDGRTGVIGGLLRNRVTEDDRKVPLLGDIPVLGWLFRKKSDEVQQRNLTIFITPRIVPLGTDSDYDQQKAALRSRLSGIKPAAPAPETNVNASLP